MRFYYVLDKTYRDGINYQTFLKVIKPLLKSGQSVKEYINKNETSIYLAFTIKSKYYKVRTPFRIKPAFWANNQQVKPTHHNSFEMNAGLVLLRQRVEKSFQMAINDNPAITVSEVLEVIKNAVAGVEPKADPMSFWSAYNAFVDEKRKTVKGLTMKKYKNLSNLLHEFEQKNYPITWKGLNSSFEVDLKFFFSNNKKHLNNTIAKHIALLKTFLNWTIDKEIHSITAYRKFTVKEEPCDIIYLTEDELMKLINLDLSYKPYLARIRDRFCLAALTGQRHSDIRNFKYSDIQPVDDGYEWWLFQVKGNKAKKVVIPLSNTALTIINRYPKTIGKDTILPAISNTNANLFVKELCKVAGINELVPIVKYSGKRRIEKVEPKYEFITMHTARKTFVTLSLEKGLSPEFVMDITGHEDYKTMRKYLAISKNAVRKEFNRVWNSTKSEDGNPSPPPVLRVV
jgi:integrase